MLAVACLGAALAVLTALAMSAGGNNGNYEVRAIFDDAGNIIPGEQVKIAGVKVGKVGSVTPTPQAKAAVVLKIEKEGFKDFRDDASCEIRPQALIGEKYVDCLPTQPRVPGTPLPPPLNKIPSGQEGSGQYLLPVKNNSSPVDVDLLGDINRLPERERLTIILNELGAGLAGRGSDLHEVIQRANPALREFDRVLSILASENKVLNQLAVDSDKALAPFARVREHVADFLVQSNTVAQASAAQRGALARNLQLFPPFLRQLVPAMQRLERFADQTLPTFTNLNKAAPSISSAFVSLPGFSKASETFLISTGKTARRSGPALTSSKKLLAELKALGTPAKPFSENLASLFTSLRNTGGLERIMDFIFLGAGAANGYDQLGSLPAHRRRGWSVRQILHQAGTAVQPPPRHGRRDDRGDEGERRQRRRRPRDGADAGGAQRRHARAGEGQIPGHPGSRRSRGRHAPRLQQLGLRAERAARRRLERRDHLLLAVGRKPRSRRDAPQLPAGQLRWAQRGHIS